jgi:hypothetical protein
LASILTPGRRLRQIGSVDFSEEQYPSVQHQHVVKVTVAFLPHPSVHGRDIRLDEHHDIWLIVAFLQCMLHGCFGVAAS